jgi:hypothetical protein
LRSSTYLQACKPSDKRAKKSRVHLKKERGFF